MTKISDRTERYINDYMKCCSNELESVEDMIKNLHNLVKCHIGVFNVTDDEEENTYKFITKFEDTISTGAISDIIMSTRILTSVEQYTYQRFRV